MAKRDDLKEIHDFILSSIIEQGMHNHQAIMIAANVAEVIKDKMGGQPLYIKKYVHEIIENRNKTICLQFTGDNHYELATAFNLSLKRIYEIVKKDPYKRQMSVFD